MAKRLGGLTMSAKLTGKPQVIRQGPALAQFLDTYRAEIGAAWSALIYDHAMFHPDTAWLDSLLDSTNRALAGLSELLATGESPQLTVYLYELSLATLRSGFESGEVTESLLLCKDAVLPKIGQVYANDTATALAMTAALDAAMRWMVRQFVSTENAGMNQRLREQHERMVTMINSGQHAPSSLALDEVLRYVAEGIIAAVQVNHCDFYLISEDRRNFTPKVGIRLVPLTPVQDMAFLSYFPQVETDNFLRDVLRLKAPVACDNTALDPRTNLRFAREANIKSVLAVPLMMHDEVLAIAVTGTFEEYRAFTADQIELARDIANAAALVIENARLYEKMRYVAVLEERERLAREMHDNLAQALSLVHVQVSHLETLLNSDHIDQAQTFLAETKHLVSEAYTDARDAIYSLRHGAATAVAFLPTLQNYLDHYRSSYGLSASLIVRDDRPIMLPNEAVIQLTRIVQEALTNARKHADATEIRVELERTPGTLWVLVQDNGHGFDESEVATEGKYGLHVMRERAESLGGNLDIQTIPGQGTTIIATIPLTEES